MSIVTFIPEIWSARLLANLNPSMVYANLLNRDYEGEIKNVGDKVHINSFGKITIKKYTKSTDIDAPEELTTTDQELVVDQSNYFNMAIDDIDKVQAAGDLMDIAMQEAAYGLANEAEKYIAGLLKTGTAGKKLETIIGNDSTPVQVTKDNAYEILVNLKTALDRANVPKVGRWVVMPPEYEGFMLLDPRFAYNTGKAESRLENGAVARAGGFDIYISNNAPNEDGAKNKIIASYRGAATYAEQILNTEAFRPEKRFSDAVKGLHVFGAKVIRPETVAVATVNFTAGA